MASYHLILVASIMCLSSSVEPLEEVLDWEDFQAALVEDGSDEGISLLQSKVTVKFTSLPSESQDSLRAAEHSRESSGALDDISPDDFADTLSEEKVPEAVSLMQTEAHIERTSTHSSKAAAMVANADGSVVVETKHALPLDGIVHMSVGGDGSFSWEGATEGLSLVQKEATLKVEGAKVEEETRKIESDNRILPEAIKDDSVEGISLLQTDAHIQTLVTKADGSIVSERKALEGDEGIMSMSVDADGSSEAISLIQRQAGLKIASPTRKKADEVHTLKVEEEKKLQEEKHAMSDISAESFAEALDISAKEPGAVSLLQIDAHVQKTSVVTEADGSISVGSEAARPHDGIVHMSVGAHGAFQWEI